MSPSWHQLHGWEEGDGWDNGFTPVPAVCPWEQGHPGVTSPVSGAKREPAIPSPWGTREGRAAKRNQYITGGPGTPCSPETPTSPLGPWGGMERSEVSVGVEGGYKLPWGPETPSPGTRQGMGSDPTPGSHHGKTTLSALHFPAPDLPPPCPTSFLPSPFLSPEPPALQSSPSSPRVRHAWILVGSCRRGRSPACPACRAPRGHRDGLCVPKGEEDNREHPWAEQQGRGSILTAASPGETLPVTPYSGVPTGDVVRFSIPPVTWRGSVSHW